jgi:preprotein translocase subunit SecF
MNVKAMRGDSPDHGGTISGVNQVTCPTDQNMITAGATLLSVLSLYLFGGEALRGFAFTMLVGIVSAPMSTVFIASALATRLSQTPHLVSNRTPHGSLRVP